MPEITIGNITAEDIDEIIQLGKSTPELHINDDPEYYSKEMLLSFIQSPNDIYLIAKADGKLAGYFLGTYNPYLKEAYFIDIVVKSDYRGQGIASAFYKKAFEMLKEKGCVWAWTLVHEDNENMKQVVQKKGFIPGKKFQFFYRGT